MGQNNSKKGLAVLIGVAAGAAAGYWLNTTKGKLWRKRAMDSTADFRDEMGHMSDAAREKAREFSGNVGVYAEEAKVKASHFAEDAKHRATEYADTMASKVTNAAKKSEDYVVNKASNLAHETEKSTTTAKDALKEGIERAKSRLNDLDSDLQMS